MKKVPKGEFHRGDNQFNTFLAPISTVPKVKDVERFLDQYYLTGLEREWKKNDFAGCKG